MRAINLRCLDDLDLRALLGERRLAQETFERATAHANDLGLLSEEVDPESGALLGNFPRAFSHIGLINAAWAISGMQKELEQAPRS